MLKSNRQTIILSLILITSIFLCGCSAEKKQKDESLEIKSKDSEYINFKEELQDMGVTQISKYFSNNITSIVATDYCITPDSRIYIFDDIEKISDFVSILSKTHWSEPNDNWDASKEFTAMRFELKSGKETTTTINMLAWMVDCYGVVEIVGNGKSEIFEISESAYLDMRAFATKKYYLHESDLEMPAAEYSLQVKNRMLSDLNYDEKNDVCSQLRNAHYNLESLLLENVSFLKEPNSSGWDLAITGHSETVEKGDFSFNGILKIINNISASVKDEETKNLFNKIYQQLKKACDERDIETVFLVHEYIHDYDYFAINYPANYKLAAADWGGLNVYFGHIEDLFK